MPARSGVLVDIDGTLVDSNYLHALAWKRAFAEIGHPDIPTADVHRAVGMGSDLVPKFILGRDAPEAAEVRRPIWRQLRQEIRAFPHAADLLATLHDRGLAVVLATSAEPDDLDNLLDKLGADPRTIDGITTSGEVTTSKPHPDVFGVAMHKANLDPARSIALGDTIWDVEAAMRAGIACIGVTTGGISPHDLLAAGAVRTYKDVAEIRTRLDESPIATLLRAA